MRSSSATEMSPRRRGISRARARETLTGLAFIAPLLAGLAIFDLGPLVATIGESFTRSLGFGRSEWVGIAAYLDFFVDPVALGAIVNTLLYSLGVLLGIPLALLFAEALNRKGLRGRGIYRTLYFVPVITMTVAAAMVWKWIFNGEYGILNAALAVVGIDGPYWLTDRATVMLAMVIVGVWMSLGYNIVIYLAGLQAIPTDVYEAAELDGAGWIRRFVSLTVPMVSPTTAFLSVTTMISSLQMFDLVYIMIGPTNPAIDSARTIVYMFYETGFIKQDRGHAAAIAVMVMLFILVIALIQVRLQRRWTHYEV